MSNIVPRYDKFYMPNKKEYQDAGLFGPYLDLLGPFETEELAQAAEAAWDAEAAAALAPASDCTDSHGMMQREHILHAGEVCAAVSGTAAHGQHSNGSESDESK